MYLKSLTLKGFKSFADRTQLSFDPGLNVIVGPNGSGKSNVSDAILWVLGEQSAKQLRGSAMEDVIFSGSSARKAVGVAEVTLVLDNSDRTLPVEFDEVGVTRRMYRSGESEYLINSAPARLMDIQDILHDSGLGRETSSIISQGKLDAVLQARPEERRQLIEEAAGISKHKRRKERSQRKLASMDDNIRRAKDVSREINRQLRPLERQVDKARRAQEIEGRLDELECVLAVDDLRSLQQEWDHQQVVSKEAAAAQEIAQFRLDEKAAELERLQLMLEKKGLFVGDLGEQRRRMQGVLGRLESDRRLLEEKGRNMVERLSETRLQLSSCERQRSEALQEHERVADEHAQARVRAQELERRIAELAPASRAATEQRQRLARELARVTADQRTAQRTADQETLAHAKLRDRIASAEAEDQMFAGRLAQIDDQVAQANAALEDREERSRRVQEQLSEHEALVEQAEARIVRASQALVPARSEEARLREELSSARASLSGLRAAEAQAEATNPLVQALAKGDAGQLAECRLGDVMEVDEELEPVIERLLGDDLAGFVTADAGRAGELVGQAEKLASRGGRAVVLGRSAYTEPEARELPGVALTQRMRVRPGAEGLIQDLLGDVRVVDSADEAIAAHAKHAGVTFVTRTGVCVCADGRMVVTQGAGAGEGALERKRSIRAVEARIPELEQEQRQAAATTESLEEELSHAREGSASAKGEVARLRGEQKSVTSELGRLRAQLDRARDERKQVEAQRAAAAERARSAREEVERHQVAAREAAELAAQLMERMDSLGHERREASRAEDEAARKLSDARLELATVAERRNNLAVREEELSRRVADLASRRASLEESARGLEVVRLRVGPLHERYSAIQEVAVSWAERLRDRASLEEASSDSLKKTIALARDEVAAAQTRLAEARDAVSDAKVASGKLEVEVRNAVEAITSAGHVLEEALLLPAPADRASDEAEVASLRKQLASIGPVNQVAMEEYETLKRRADYIAAQLDDLTRARAALTKITAAVDRKMRTAFLATYQRVDENFREIFTMLFPGGRGNLEMTDPEHPQETGIEVVAQPRGKRQMKMTLLSGGERSLTALALLFAVYRARTTPFYVFDEVEAALDDSNLDRLLDAIDMLKESTQLVVISHQRRTMEQADVLYGVSMQADGVSHVISQRLEHEATR